MKEKERSFENHRQTAASSPAADLGACVDLADAANGRSVMLRSGNGGYHGSPVWAEAVGGKDFGTAEVIPCEQSHAGRRG